MKLILWCNRKRNGDKWIHHFTITRWKRFKLFHDCILPQHFRKFGKEKQGKTLMGSNLVTLYKKPDKGLNHKEVLKNFKICDCSEVYWLWTTKFQEKVWLDLRFIKGSCSISDLLKTNPANAVFTSVLVVVFKISWIDQRHTVVSGQVLGENIGTLSSANKNWLCKKT